MTDTRAQDIAECERLEARYRLASASALRRAGADPNYRSIARYTAGRYGDTADEFDTAVRVLRRLDPNRKADHG